MKLKFRLFRSRKILLGAISIAALAVAVRAEVPYANANPFERSIFGDDWGVLSNDIFFGGARGMFGLSPASRTFVLSMASASTKTAESNAIVNATGSGEDLSSFASSVGSPFAIGRGGPVSGGGGGGLMTPSASTGGSGFFYLGQSGNWNADGAWGPNATIYPDAVGAIASDEQQTDGTIVQNVPGSGAGITVGTILHNPASPLNAGPGVDWLITTNSPITMDEDGDGAGSAHITNANSAKINTLTIDGSGGLILADNLIITNANPNGGFINIATTISGAGKNVTILGPGTTLFNAANTFSGSTTVGGGTLNVSATNALGSTSNVTVNTGGTLLFSGPTIDRIRDVAPINLNGGALNTGGLSEGTPSAPGMGALTLTLANTIDLGTNSSLISFADSSGQSWTGATLRILNWTGTIGTGDGTDQVYFGTTAGGLTQAQLDQISFYSDAAGLTFLGTGMILTDGEVVPVPEPATWIGGALALGAIGFSRLRKRQGTAARRLAS